MKRSVLDIGLAVAALFAVATATRRLAGGEPEASMIRATPALPLVGPDSTIGDSLQAAVENTVAHDPFRLSNSPATSRDDAAGSPAGKSAPMAVHSSRPALVLKAIVGGPPWQAIIAGLPGQSGETVVSAGVRFDPLIIKTITRDSVVVQAPDTTWKLTLRRSTP